MYCYLLALFVFLIVAIAMVYFDKESFKLQKKNYRPYLQHLYDRPYWWYWPNSTLLCDGRNETRVGCKDVPWFGYRSSWY
jgi:hypothetical protein